MNRGPNVEAGEPDLLVDALARRLSRVDDELPRLAPWRGAPSGAAGLHVVRGRTTRTGSGLRTAGPIAAGAPIRGRRSEASAVSIAAVVLVAFLVGRSVADAPKSVGPGAPSTSQVSAEATPASAASAASTPAAIGSVRPSGPVASSRPEPSPRTAQPAVDLDALRRSMTSVGWSCGVLVQVALAPLPAALLAKLDAVGRLVDGALPAELGPVWIGSDPVGASRAFKGRPLVTDRSGAAWILRGSPTDGAILQLVGQRSPGGSLVWRSAAAVWPIDCRAASADMKTLLADRAADDWPAGRVIDLSIVVASRSTARLNRPS
jgi:hypothetical protein